MSSSAAALRLLHLDDCPHVVRLTVDAPSRSLAVWVTDLCGIYERELAAADVDALLQKHGLTGSDPTQLLSTMLTHFETNNVTSKFELHAQPMRLRWVLTGMQVFGDGLELEPCCGAGGSHARRARAAAAPWGGAAVAHVAHRRAV